MKRITKEELPEILTDDIINVLVKMALEDPKLTFDWANVSDLLEERGQLRVILDKVRVIKKSIEQAKEDSKSEKQKLKEKQDWQEFLKNADPNGFYGNMGEPVTLEDYKLRYGRYPVGYDGNGNKI
jgi:hypothetical protein